jgi:hypothetical protein
MLWVDLTAQKVVGDRPVFALSSRPQLRGYTPVRSLRSSPGRSSGSLATLGHVGLFDGFSDVASERAERGGLVRSDLSRGGIDEGRALMRPDGSIEDRISRIGVSRLGCPPAQGP